MSPSPRFATVFALLFVSTWFISQGTALAGEVTYTNGTAFRYNPLALGDEFRLGYNEKLWNKPKDDLLFGSAHVWAGTNIRFSPTYLSTGLFVKTVPIAVLELQGSMNRVLSWTTMQDIRDRSYGSPATLDAANEAGSSITSGWLANLQGRFQIKAGPIAARSTALFRHFDLEGEEGSSFYHQGMDVVTPFSSWVLQEDSDLLYMKANNSWILGFRYTYTHPFSEGTTDIQRAGPLFVWKLDDPNPDPIFQEPSLILLCQWHIEHKWRTGQSMHQGFPYFLVAYTFKGQLTE